MNNKNIGLIFFLLSAIIYGSTLISASIYSRALAEIRFNSEYGIFGYALREVGTFPITISILLVLAGVYLIKKN